MINSLCGSMGNLKGETSVSSNNQLQPPPQTVSPTVSASESNVTGFERNESSLSNLNFQALKFEDDLDEVQSPNSSIWDSLFSTDQIDSIVDFMMSSPKRTPDYMISSPKRGQVLGTQNHNYNYYIQGEGQNPSFGCLHPSHLSATYTNNTMHAKGKGLSPLHKVFNSPSNLSSNQFMQPDQGLALPAMDGFMEDFHRNMNSLGDFASPLRVGNSMIDNFDMPGSTNLSSMLDCLPAMQNSSSSFCGSGVNEVAVQGGGSLQINNHQERDLYQMNSFIPPPPQAQQQQQQQTTTLQQQLQRSDHSLRELLSEGTDQDQDSGLQLVHLLLACAEAVAKGDYMSARKYLQHLDQVVSPLGDSMQRVASCFTEALTARLTATISTNPNTSNSKTFIPFPPNTIDVLRIYQILYQACPYIKFAHFTANQAIFEAFTSEERVHVIDLDILQGYQWPSFMQALAARTGGAPFLRITGVGSPPELVRETGRGLTELAHSLNLPFEFHPLSERLEDLKPHMFQRRVGEALAVNSVNRLHRVPGNCLGDLLGMIRDQAPNIVTLVEQEASHNGPYFLGRFLEALHYYSAIFDSLHATFPADSAERVKVEQYIFAPEIRNIVAYEGLERVERHERLEKWRKVMKGKGFKEVQLSQNALTQSKILLGLYSCDGYRLTEDRGCLLLGWQDRSIVASSAWRC